MKKIWTLVILCLILVFAVAGDVFAGYSVQSEYRYVFDVSGCRLESRDCVSTVTSDEDCIWTDWWEVSDNFVTDPTFTKLLVKKDTKMDILDICEKIAK
jgi:hypothetical protein